MSSSKAIPSSIRELWLKPGRERSVQQRHPWVFTGAIARAAGPSIAPLAIVRSAKGEQLASGFFSAQSQISARLYTFEQEMLTPELIEQRIVAAIERRAHITAEGTNALRLVHSEGDDLSGLVVDRYDDLLVVEITAAGLESWKEVVVSALRNHLSPRGVFFKNQLPARKLEGLSQEDQWDGDGEPEVTVMENGHRFRIAPRGAQKTGFFLDQRENRRIVGELSRGRHVLNLFAYSGAFGVYAAKGGAASVQEVDVSAPALELAKINHELNGTTAETSVADAFDYSRKLLREEKRFDLIVCDPPAFAKNRGDVDRAARGYKDINLQVMKLATPGAYVATFSCSGHISNDLFQKIIFSAALDAKRSVSIVQRLGAGEDHPVSLYCPEGEYLKGLLLRVS